METAEKTAKLRISGMTCVNCQNKIEKRLSRLPGVRSASVSYVKATASISYDPGRVSIQNMVDAIEKLGYEAPGSGKSGAQGIYRTVGLLIVIAAIFLLLEWFGVLKMLVPGRLAETGMGYGMLFVIGLVTSVHCVAMCGGLNLSQCIPKREKTVNEGHMSALRPAFLYNLGRVVSYTVIGFAVGALGNVIVFSATAQGVLKLAAGVFMIVMGVNMLGIFPWLHRLTPRLPKAFAGKIAKGTRGGSPLIVGLLNGLMPCGPLQAVQIYALSTGNPFAGALSMLMFSLGTVPLMFGFGALGSVLGRKSARRVMTVGAVLVAVLGLSMLSQGLSLSGVAVGTGMLGNPAVSGVTPENGVQRVNSTLSPYEYPDITVQAGTPVKWVIEAPLGSINGCNNRMIIREYDIEHTFAVGDNVIEFTPVKAGTYHYSCWMGMIYGTIRVVNAGDESAAMTSIPVSVTAALETDLLREKAS